MRKALAGISICLSLVACGPGGDGSDGEIIKSLAACGDEAPYSVSPFALSDINPTEGIIPLGNLNPAAHTFPTVHLYIGIKDSKCLCT